MVNPTQDNFQASVPAMKEPVPREPGPGAQRAAESQRATMDIPLAEGPRGLGGLALGLGLLAAAFVVFWMGLYLPNHVALRVLAASFGTFGLAWLLVRLRVFHRPHGVLIAVGAVALFAAVVPFVERGFQKLDQAAKAGLGGIPADGSKDTAVQPVPQAPPVPVQPPESKPAAPPEDEVVREFIAPAPDPSMGKVIRITQDANVTIAGRKFVLRAGSMFPFKRFSDGSVTFTAGDQEVTISSELVAFTGQSQETPAEITKLAMEELKKRYPKVFEKGTRENNLFVDRTKELKVELPDLFTNPRWPLEIGEQLATQEGWRRGDKDEDAAPPNQPNEPAASGDLLPPAEPLPVGQPTPPDLPQMAPK